MYISTHHLLWLQSLACAECHHSLVIEPKAMQRLPKAIPPFLHSTPLPLIKDGTAMPTLYDVQDALHWPCVTDLPARVQLSRGIAG